MEVIPYARPYWDDDEIAAVTAAIRSGTWTNGPVVRDLERALGSIIQAKEVACVSSGTAAIHAVLHILKRRADGPALYITSSLNFVAGPSAARLLGYDVAFTDVDGVTLNMSPVSLHAILSDTADHYRLIVVNPVHFAGVVADMDALGAVAESHGALIFEDACHAIGARVAAHPSSLGAVFSFHPTKNVAAGEGGAFASNHAELMAGLRLYSNHWMNRADFVRRSDAYDDDGAPNPWYYEVAEPGTNLRLSELHAAVALCQVRRLEVSLARRRELAMRYRDSFDGLDGLTVYPRDASIPSALHLFPVEFQVDRLGISKAQAFSFFRERGIIPQVHYTPLHRMPAFSDLELVRRGSFTSVDSIISGLLSLPLYHGLHDEEQTRVISAVKMLCARGGGRR